MSLAIQAERAITKGFLKRGDAQVCYLSTGRGPAIVVVPGALSIAADYQSFAQALASNYTVHILERRGRGDSSPQGPHYGIGQECADLVALLESTGASLVVGHSFGGLVCLEAARNHPRVRKIAVYEPGVSIGKSIPMHWMVRYRNLLEGGKKMDAFVVYSLALGPDRARRTPEWLMRRLLPFFVSRSKLATMLELLEQNWAEHSEIQRLDSQVDRYKEIRASVLLMSGEKTGIG